jgi:hypothetical protein
MAAAGNGGQGEVVVRGIGSALGLDLFALNLCVGAGLFGLELDIANAKVFAGAVNLAGILLPKGRGRRAEGDSCKQ